MQKWTGTAAVGPGETAPIQRLVPCEHPCSRTIHAGSLETPARGGRGRRKGRGGGRGEGEGEGEGEEEEGRERERGRGRGRGRAWLATFIYSPHPMAALLIGGVEIVGRRGRGKASLATGLLTMRIHMWSGRLFVFWGSCCQSVIDKVMFWLPVQ